MRKCFIRKKFPATEFLMGMLPGETAFVSPKDTSVGSLMRARNRKKLEGVDADWKISYKRSNGDKMIYVKRYENETGNK